MARNKHPEETIEKILNTSMRLFSKKGFDKTTIQDIVNELGMSKGAIYHHFKSKEEILDALGNRYYNDNSMFLDLRQRTDLNVLEKIREAFMHQINDLDKVDMDTIVLNVWQDPKFFMMSMKENLTENAKYLVPILEEGMKDGSIRKQDATCASQILILLLNFWLLSPITGFKTDDLRAKIHYLRYLSESMGIPVINDKLEAMTNAYFLRLSKSFTPLP